MRDINELKLEYMENWRVLLSELLGWPESRITSWIKSAERRFDMANPNAWVYHDLPLHAITPVIMRHYVADDLSDSDFQYLEDAIQQAFEYGLPDFTQVTDWSFYKEQLACVLSDFSRQIKPEHARRKELAAKA